jgi:hypothetical protein
MVSLLARVARVLDRDKRLNENVVAYYLYGVAMFAPNLKWVMSLVNK